MTRLSGRSLTPPLTRYRALWGRSEIYNRIISITKYYYTTRSETSQRNQICVGFPHKLSSPHESIIYLFTRTHTNTPIPPTLWHSIRSGLPIIVLLLPITSTATKSFEAICCIWNLIVGITEWMWHVDVNIIISTLEMTLYEFIPCPYVKHKSFYIYPNPNTYIYLTPTLHCGRWCRCMHVDDRTSLKMKRHIVCSRWVHFHNALKIGIFSICASTNKWNICI